VIASVGSDAHRAQLTGAGADEVTVGVRGIDTPVDVVLDTVGGPQMVEAWQLLALGGTLESIGWASSEPAVCPLTLPTICQTQKRFAAGAGPNSIKRQSRRTSRASSNSPLVGLTQRRLAVSILDSHEALVLDVAAEAAQSDFSF
jgi:NADPH:quinone reductase-like Zn-dependent oxidoreductase